MELRQFINSINSELYRASKASRRGFIKIGFITLILLAGKSLTEARISLPFSLRGGYIALSSYTSPMYEHKQRKRNNHINPVLYRLDQLQNSLSLMGSRIQSETYKHWTGIASHVEKEWSKLAKFLKLFPTRQKASIHRLDDVLTSFKSVLRNGKEVDISQLLKACRAHLTLVKSGGAALRLVAKDMENNLQKAEALHSQLRKSNKGQNLSSMLSIERELGLHNGNILKDDSAAMGLLWIRRSLTFQMDLYSSLLPSSTKSPSDAAMEAYNEHLLPYHGWMLQKIFPMSLSQMPEKDVFIAKFGGMERQYLNEVYEKEIVGKLSDLVRIWEPLISAWKEEFERMDMEDVRRA
ncbi:hypothetical protein ACHAWO_000732 [Cyclotella atomus]|uniref:Glycolipid transfer protein domain-containing protein n=1 Tax=Cyclotella atomus TaxID=382360 RepID=A0ABD3PET5_9STRA